MKGIKSKIRSNKYLKWLLIISNFINSGLKGADNTERLLKLIRITIFFAIFYFIIKYFIILNTVLLILISFFLGYFCNWLFHFNRGTLIIHYLGYGQLKKDAYFDFMYLMKKIATNKPNGIAFIAAFGSISRGMLHSRSDLDATVVRKQGIINAIFAFYYIEKIRRLASRKSIPFDSALGDSIAFVKKKYRADESPIVIFDPDNMVDKYYNKKISIEEAERLNPFNEKK